MMALSGEARTLVPRWSAAAGGPARTAEHDSGADPDLAAVIRSHGSGDAADTTALLLAAHVTVLGALAGERDVRTGYARRGRVLPFLITLRDRPCSELLDDVRRTETQLWRRWAPSAPGDAPDVVLEVDDGRGYAPELGDHTLWVRADPRTGRFRLWYRTDALDADHAARVAGYHRAALEHLTRHPGTDHSALRLVSTAERDLQLSGMGGPDRELPDARFHELVEDRARRHPHAVAVAQGTRRWTYAELNSRANRIAHALLSRGLEAEDVVAVVTERGLEWAAAVLAIFKAGGAYLPIDPQFPADRIDRTLTRSGARLVLTEAQSANGLPVERGDVLLIEDVVAEDHADTDPRVPVTAGQLAYVYFTSGSTGEPKGAMCEHAGLLNHLFAKIDDLEIGEGSVVAQTAPQCFDISLWQLVSALVVGGRTVIVEQDAVLDVERLVSTIADGGVTVLQLVPSYLETLLSHLDQQPHGLPHLRCVSTTGEALKKELVTRWFATYPEKALVNAYGLTETSDDTNHEVLHAAPAGDRVPLGRPVNNVHVYVVDEALEPVPLGSTGEIVFSGVCVGRGYLNDPERTEAAFLADPHRPGHRLYRSGDFGRWLPGGTLGFLGRRDAQVKIRGFRIEIGEIENQLLKVAGVRDGAVVVLESAAGGRSLVGFYTAGVELPADDLTSALAGSLPEYMIPTTVHFLDFLPSTANGKIDKKALAATAAELAAAGPAPEAPRTSSEWRLVKAWARVLSLPPEQIGRGDRFFDRGGTSLSALHLMVALDRELSLRQLVDNPVLADLAAVLDDRRAAGRKAPPVNRIAGSA
ncbi:MAG: non-ribosomal peptide synthetase [Pseudonocardiaceae bacterium]